MPSTATITSFYVFSVNERPRIGLMNGNFSNFRGHLIPIDPNTATAAASRQYDLGASEYRWMTGYISKLDISATSTAALTLEAVTTGEFHFKNAGTSGFQITPTGFIGYNNKPSNGITTSAYLADIAASPILSVSLSVTGSIAGSTCTLQTNGRPVLLCFLPDVNTTTSGPGGILVDASAVASAPYNMARIAVQRDGVIIAATDLKSKNESVEHFLGEFKFYDFPAAGTHNYSLSLETLGSSFFGGTAGGDVLHLIFRNTRFTAVEL